MAKTQALDAADLVRVKPSAVSGTRQRGIVPSAELQPLQFKMPPDFVKAFKQAALNHNMKLNEFLKYCFEERIKELRAGK